MTWYDVLLWGVLPYVVIAILVSGTIWRYRYDRSAGPPAPRSSTSHGCCASAARCSTSDCSS